MPYGIELKPIQKEEKRDGRYISRLSERILSIDELIKQILGYHLRWRTISSSFFFYFFLRKGVRI